MTPFGYVIVDVKFDERLWRAHVDLYKQWRVEYEAAHPAPPVVNIRFKHDPNWRGRVASVMAAREGVTFWSGRAHPVWIIVGVVWYAATAAFVVGTVALATLPYWAF